MCPKTSSTHPLFNSFWPIASGVGMFTTRGKRLGGGKPVPILVLDHCMLVISGICYPFAWFGLFDDGSDRNFLRLFRVIWFPLSELDFSLVLFWYLK